MPALDWSVIAKRLIQYYYPTLILLPVFTGIILTDKRKVRAEKLPLLLEMGMFLLIVLADVFEYALSIGQVPSMWRVAASVVGFVMRPMCLYVLLYDTLPKEKHSIKTHIILIAPAAVNALVFSSAFYSHIAFWYDSRNEYQRGPLFWVVIAVSVLYMIMLFVIAIQNMKGVYRRKALSVLVISASCFIAALIEMAGLSYPSPLLNQTMTIGTAMYYLVQYVTASTIAIENITLSLLLMQIRPHFINNSLAAIRGMIRRNPDEAAEALSHFSGYLQDTMYSVLNTEMIPFSQELNHIDNYFYMERVRFRDTISLNKELIPVDLPVPPLTVQPLVENAVRHGLRGMEGPGEVSIRTEMDSKEYRVIVEDNGCGFDTTQPPDSSRPHVGLQNVRSRLQMMCNGTLSITSIPGKGTTAVIHIPVKALSTVKR